MYEEMSYLKGDPATVHTQSQVLPAGTKVAASVAYPRVLSYA